MTSWRFARVSLSARVRRAILGSVLAMLLAVSGVSLSADDVTAAPKFSAMTVDARTGEVLYAQDPDGMRHPASLTKMMTLYILFEELKAGRLGLQSNITVSARATGMAPSKLGIRAGGTITVETAIQALVVKSANDVAAAVAETISGTEKAFAKRMTTTARAIGMSRTTFANASGLPNPAQVTTARDMATLGLRLMRDFPQYYPYFRTRSFVFQGRTIKGHNRLLGSYEGTDGIKTGFINASGFNLVSSVRRGDKRLVGVVMGGRSGASRDTYMKKMLSEHFDEAKAGKTVAAYAGSAKGAVPVEEVQPEAPDANVAAVQQTAPAPKKPVKKKDKPQKKKDVAATATSAEESAEPAQAEDEDSIGELAAEVAGSQQAPAADPSQSQPAPDNQTSASAVETVPQPSEESTDAQGTAPADTPFVVKTPEQQLADQAQVASITPPQDTGWTITLGDYATKKDAQAVLQLMRKRTPDAVAGKTAQTVMVEKDGNVTFRARFTGFDQSTAAAACKAIKAKNTPCQTLGPS